MKKEWIRNVVALVLLGGLVVYVSWNRKTTVQEAEKAEKAKKLVQFEMDTIDRIEIRNKEGKVVLEKRKKDGKGFNDPWAQLSIEQDEPTDWMMTEPIPSLVDKSILKTFQDNVKELTANKVIDEKGTNPETYNLKDPPLEIVLFEKDKTSPKLDVKFGDENSSNSGLYLQDSTNPKIVLVSTTLSYAKTRKPNEWRAKEVLGIKDLKKVKTVDAQYQDKGKFFLAKNESNWTVKTTQTYRADERAVEGFLNEIKGLRADDIVSEDGVLDTKKYGFDHPYAKITYTFESDQGLQTRTLWIGSVFDGEKGIYVRRTDYPQVYKVGWHNKATLTKQGKDLVDKRPFSLDQSKVDRVSIVHNGQKYELAQKEGTWNLAKPVKDQADSGEARAIISKLLSLRGEEFLTELKDIPEGKPTSVFTLQEGPKVQELAMYDAKGTLKGVKSSPKIMAFKFERNDYDQILSKLDALREKNLMPFEEMELNSFRIKKGAFNANFTRETSGGWKLATLQGADAPLKAKLEKKDAIDEIVREVGGLKISDFLDQEKISDQFQEDFYLELSPKTGKAITWNVSPGKDGKRTLQSKERGVVGDAESKGFENLEKLISNGSNKG